MFEGDTKIAHKPRHKPQNEDIRFETIEGDEYLRVFQGFLSSQCMAEINEKLNSRLTTLTENEANLFLTTDSQNLYIKTGILRQRQKKITKEGVGVSGPPLVLKNLRWI